ncbi:hypothetical protein D777_01984 [Marinobacter nitratireducens]|uniref:Oligosaccharide repeat unit polymerase n=1 Tax=Marinobacter nitratireducens TaxID=1137280 RepID=A0A072NEZ4_9GAMM|nr:O-antigen polymerase [Marinobacter nitratireducens]KEF31635.1 hypothetical protein D777_01984 [Marinobacter nitratireducens]
MTDIRSLVFIATLILAVSGFSFYAIYPVSSYQSVSRELLFVFLLFFCFGVPLAYLLKSGWSREYPIFADPVVYFPLIFCLYCGLGGITYGSELEVSKEVYYYYYLLIFSFFLGCFASGIFEQKSSKFHSFSPQAIDDRVFSTLLIFVLIVALVSQVLILNKVGLVFLSSDFQSERTGVIDRVGGYLYYLSLLSIDFVILSLFYRVLKGRFPFNRVFFVSAMLVCILILLSMGSRTRVIYPLLVSFVFLYLLFPKKVPLSKVILLIVFLAIFLFVYGSIRYMTGEGGTFGEAFSRIFLGEIKLSSITFDMVQKHVPDSLDFLGMKVLVMPFLTLLPGDDEVLVNILKESLGLTYEGGGFTPSLTGSLYIINGIWSVVFGGFLFGLMMRKAYFIANRAGPEAKLLFAFLIVYSLNSLKGGLFKDLEPVWHATVLYFTVFISKKLSIK